MNRILKHSLFFTIFFFIFYIESKTIAGIKIAILWKISLLSLIAIYILFSTKEKIKKYIIFGYLYSAKSFVTYSSFSYIISTISEVLKSLYIVLFSHFFKILYEKHKIDLVKFLIIISCYIIISSIPFLLNIITSLTAGYNLERFGLKGFGFNGIFDNSHYAASVIAFSIIILVYAIQKEPSKYKKFFYFTLIFIGLIAEVKTFARLGYAIILFGSTYLLIVNKGFKFYLKLFIPLLIVISSVIIYYTQSESFQMRLSGENKYSKSSLDSGRSEFAKNAIENWYEEDIDVILIGLGKEYAMDKMENDVGLRIYAHNGFIDVLQINGMIGVFLFLAFFIYLFLFIRSNRKHKYYQLTFSLFIGYSISMLVQGERFFLSDVILALGISLLYIKDNKRGKIS